MKSQRNAVRKTPRQKRRRRSKKATALQSRPGSRLTQAQIDEMFARFQAADPDPKTELRYTDNFTLLVAVVLSAQATDDSVNRATPGLFALADTPQKIVALGEAGRHREDQDHRALPQQG